MFDAATFLSNEVRAPPRLFPPSSSVGFSPEAVCWFRDGVPPLSRAARGAKLAGLKYEQRVADVLSAIYGSAFVRSPMIRYRLRDSEHRAIPDGILRLDGPSGPSVLIVEVKLAHTEGVWDQLSRYLALVSSLEPRSRIRTIEVCRSYDPAIVLPGPHSLIDSLHRPKAGVEVLVWKI